MTGFSLVSVHDYYVHDHPYECTSSFSKSMFTIYLLVMNNSSVVGTSNNATPRARMSGSAARLILSRCVRTAYIICQNEALRRVLSTF